MLSVAPIGSSGPTSRQILFCARRIGLVVQPIRREEVPAKLAYGWILVAKASGDCSLIVSRQMDGFIGLFPGSAPPRQPVVITPDGFDDADELFFMRPDRPGPGMALPHHHVRLWAIDFLPRRPSYDADLLAALRANRAAPPSEELQPVPLGALTSCSILSSHASICRGNEFYGTYRTINLRRDCVFVDWNEIPVALELLMAFARDDTFRSETILVRAAKIFVDFLSIHPFLNGNRRLAMTLVSRFLASAACDIDWDAMGQAETYYWVRCASRGHFRPLISGFERHVIKRR